MQFIFLFVIALLLGCCGLAYVWNRFRRFEWMPREGLRRNLVALIPVVALAAWWTSSIDGLAAIMHLAVLWAVFDVVFLPFRPHRYIAGYMALATTTAVLVYAHVACCRVTPTRYELSTAKDIGGRKLRIAFFSDAHIGTTFDGAQMGPILDDIASERPDVLLIVGDLVDDDTKRIDWERAVEAMAGFQTPLGKYFVFGNHDRGYRNRRDFPTAKLVGDLERAGVKVLRDETVSLRDGVMLIGRLDRLFSGRRTAAELLPPHDSTQYRIVMDHQPADYEAEAAAGADLVLSGHTHGGQLWPLGFLMLCTANDHVYGHVRKAGTDFLVSSGISDWALSFKTGCQSEFVIVDVTGNTPAE
ncbi:MAG: metallophosphoesterase [Victivallaceae bacterium]|nr:metallophosphoesterase [Victivallaceae bacterium]